MYKDVSLEANWGSYEYPLPPPEQCGEKTCPVPRPPVLAPYKEPTPPAHTQIQPRCFSCKHFEMCRFKRDYLKTVSLIQNDLGAPNFSYELVEKYIVIPDYIGLPIINDKDVFPAKITFDNTDNIGKFFGGKFDGINFINVVYKETKHYILIKFHYNKDSGLYELYSCQEAFYKVDYELSNESLEAIQLKLIEWRDNIIDSKLPIPPPPHKEIINTTHFAATLECDMYEWNKKTYQDCINELKNKYPLGIPIDECGRQLYHIATYHVVDDFVPFSPLYSAEKLPNEKPFFPPEPPPCPKPPRRRGDL